jgi:hypothetical protein
VLLRDQDLAAERRRGRPPAKPPGAEQPVQVNHVIGMRVRDDHRPEAAAPDGSFYATKRFIDGGM